MRSRLYSVGAIFFTNIGSITTMTESTVLYLLEDQFGDSLAGASLTQKLALMEATALNLRSGSYVFRSALQSLDSSDLSVEDTEGLDAIDFSDELTDFQDVNEGLKVLGFLHEGIIEDFSVLAANERLDS
jgi:hypothetical protein